MDGPARNDVALTPLSGCSDERRLAMVGKHLGDGSQGPAARAAHQVSRPPSIAVDANCEEAAQACACEFEWLVDRSSALADRDVRALPILSKSCLSHAQSPGRCQKPSRLDRPGRALVRRASR